MIFGATAAPAPSPLIVYVKLRTFVAANAAFAEGNKFAAAVTADVIAVEAVFAIVANVTVLAVTPRALNAMLGVRVIVTVSAPALLVTVKVEVPVTKSVAASRVPVSARPTPTASTGPVAPARLISPAPTAETVTNSPAIAGVAALFESKRLTVTVLATVAPIVAEETAPVIDATAPVTVKLNVALSSPASRSVCPPPSASKNTYPWYVPATVAVIVPMVDAVAVSV